MAYRGSRVHSPPSARSARGSYNKCGQLHRYRCPAENVSSMQGPKVPITTIDMSNVPSIPEYFKGKNIFVTGCTGFLGKVLIEKLLYSCPELGKIYVLMREKKDIKPEDRITALYNFPCFDRLRKEKPKIFEWKVKFIAGDIRETSLGISKENRALLVKETNIVFHSAASVRFNDHLAKAVKLNLHGTKHLIELAKEMPNLESFIHISTAFSNSYKDIIDEVMYPPLGDWRSTLEICESLDSQTLQVLTSKYIEGIPNTYVFTKHLTEHMIYEQKGKLPIVIYRPAVVTPSHDEPIPGWVDNFNGPTGISVATVTGILRTNYAKANIVLDMMPVDVVIKGAIIAAWNRGIKKLEVTDDIPIYNACNSGVFQMTFQDMFVNAQSAINIYPVSKMLWTPAISFYNNVHVYYVRVVLLQILPAIFIDTLLRILQMKPFLLQLQYRIFTASMALHPYMGRQWNFSNKNYLELCSKVLEKDRRSFYFDLNDLDKFKYTTICLRGGKRFLLKEKDEDLPRYRRNYKRMVILDKILKFAFCGFLLWWVFYKSYAMIQD